MTYREFSFTIGAISAIAEAAGRHAMEIIREGRNDTSGCVTLELALIAGATGLVSGAMLLGMGDIVAAPLETSYSALCQSIFMTCVRPS